MDKAIYTQMHAVEREHWWFSGRRAILESLLHHLRLPPGARILDGGSGTGGNLELLARFGRVVGMEMEPAAVAMARERGVAEIHEGRFPERIPFADGSFELVAMLDVLEHIDDDRATLEAVRALLAENGRLLITVPAFPLLWGDHDVRHHHRRRYRRRQLVARLEGAGLRVDYVGHFNFWLFPPIAAVRLLRRILPGEAADDERLPPAPLNRLLRALFASERRLLPRFSLPFGVSLVAVASRRP